MRAVILANGELGMAEQARVLSMEAELVVAANGGTRNALTAGIDVDLVVGDLDSLDDSIVERLSARNVEMIQHPSNKDETDLELALLQAADRGGTEIVVLAALGGRTDQMLANLFLMALPELEQTQVRIVAGVEVISLVRGRNEFLGQIGDILSLIPVGGDCHDIWTEGLEYPLRGESLWFNRARGISNVLIRERASVRLGRGTLLAVHRAQTLPLRWEQLGFGEDLA
jgi:thiamine pyrophosphokinase